MFINKTQRLLSNSLTLQVQEKLIKVVLGVLLVMDQKHGT
jgi:hypothetical protein